jgi:hypothetical protein
MEWGSDGDREGGGDGEMGMVGENEKRKGRAWERLSAIANSPEIVSRDA